MYGDNNEINRSDMENNTGTVSSENTSNSQVVPAADETGRLVPASDADRSRSDDNIEGKSSANRYDDPSDRSSNPSDRSGNPSDRSGNPSDRSNNPSDRFGVSYENGRSGGVYSGQNRSRSNYNNYNNNGYDNEDSYNRGSYGNNNYGNSGSYNNNPHYNRDIRSDERRNPPPRQGGNTKMVVGLICAALFLGCGVASFYAATRLMGSGAAASFGITPNNEAGAASEQGASEQAPQETKDPVTMKSAAALDASADKSGSSPAIRGTIGAATVLDVSDVVAGAMPSMVTITNKFTEVQDFFGRRFHSEGEAGGSGIIIGENDDEYLVVTNQHVIDSANDLIVQFIDHEDVNAFIKGYDKDLDIAVIAVPKKDVKESTKSQISVAVIGDSDKLVLGEPTIAIGNALGVGQSVTTGVVSALERTIVRESSDRTFIQTDAAINPGNSGGALLNSRGEVIGINSNKLGGSIVEGMGYAIPISKVQPIIEDFMNRTTRSGKTSDDKRAFLGITGTDVTADVSKTYNIPVGVYVAELLDGGAAKDAGIVMGDVITKIDGTTVKSMKELQEALSYYESGQEVEITYHKGTPGGYQEKVIKVVLGTRPKEES